MYLGDFMDELILIKYGELTTKKGNRKVFIRMLLKNINNILKGLEYRVNYDRVRMYINCNDSKEIVDRLKKIFGIHEIVICNRVNNNVEEIKAKVLEILKEQINPLKYIVWI